MITCKLELPCVATEDTRFFISRTFPFPNVPRVGEIIWIGDTLGFKIERIEYCFDTKEQLTTRLIAEENTGDWFRRNKQFLIEWGFLRDSKDSNPMTETAYPDEQYLRDQASKPMRFILASEIDLSEDRDPQVIPHNTMRFDVHMAHVYGIFEDGDITKEQVAQIISDAIIQAVNVAIGPGLDGVPIPGGIDRDIHPKSLMLHRETLSCDLS